MKKLLLLLLCVSLLFSCGEKEKKEENSLDYEIREKEVRDGYTGKGTYTFNGDIHV